MKEFDITIIGGGINGVSAAAEAASRGLNTLLVHARDLASSASATPVTLAGIHLRHLSALDYFQLNSMLDELQLLQQSAPHLIDILPVTSHDGSAIKERGSNMVERYFQAIKDKSFANLCNEGVCNRTQSLTARLKPARLILNKALQAKAYGADIRSYTRLTDAERLQDHWRLKLQTQQASVAEESSPTDSSQCEIKCKWIINCSGWWANELIEQVFKVSTRCKSREEHHTQFFFRNPGLPIQFCSDTDRVFKLDMGSGKAFYVYAVSENLFAFGPRKCDQEGFDECVDLQQSFIDCWNNTAGANKPELRIGREHFIYKRKSIVAHIDDPCSADNTPLSAPLMDLDNPGKKAVMLNIFGADTALHRKVARQALDNLKVFHRKKAIPTFKTACLPGGDIGTKCIESYTAKTREQHKNLPSALITRLCRNYGSLAETIVEGCNSEQDLGEHFGDTLYEAEVRYLLENEWVKCADDVLWRRTLQGIYFSETETTRLDNWIKATLQP